MSTHNLPNSLPISVKFFTEKQDVMSLQITVSAEKNNKLL